MMQTWILAIAYYEGMSGETKVLLVRTSINPNDLQPTDVGLTDDDSFNSIHVMYDTCNTLAWANDTNNGAAVLFDCSQDGGSEAAQASGYTVAEMQDLVEKETAEG